MRYVCLLLVPAFAVSLSASEAAAEDAVATRFAVLIGFPSSEPGTGGEALLVPGSVIPLDTDAGGGSGGSPEGVQQTLSFARAVEKLWAAFRLDPQRQFEKGKLVAAVPGKTFELPGVPEADVRVTAELRSFDAGTAVYRVVISRGDKPIADSTVKAVRGGRAVVGGLDGDKAPYIFLVVEPEDPARSSKSTERLHKSAGVTVPRVLVKVQPKYPAEAKENRITGVVVLQLMIGLDGKVQDLKVIEYPDANLSKSAVEAVRQWTFEPARQDDGTPVPALCQITVNFQLR